MLNMIFMRRRKKQIKNNLEKKNECDGLFKKNKIIKG